MQVALELCGYKDGIPRWDWSLDAANLSASPVWSSDPEVRSAIDRNICPRASSSQGTVSLTFVWLRLASEPMELGLMTQLLRGSVSALIPVFSNCQT